MKIRSLLIPVSCLSLAVPAWADTFVLKDGSRLEGRILSETADFYQLEVLVGKSIKDEKKVAKADVAEIIAVDPSEKDFEKIKALSPVPDFSSADEYARRVTLVAKFIADHPKGSKISDAQALLATLKSEAEVISGGGIKMDG
ncbi:MAG TPA: hypothetical protein VM511_12740, partial [Luteolibacter sp.]|nr:hypothetical protein [Luteolibacter sp.]